jgi:hypothetical protein
MSSLSGLRIGFATTVLPDERANGGEICSQEFIDVLRDNGADVRVVGYERVGRGPLKSDPTVYSAGPWFIEMADAGWRRILWLSRAFITHAPFTQTKFKSAAYVRALRNALGDGADLLIIDHAHMGWVEELPDLPTRKLFIAHNLEHSLYRDIAQNASAAKRAIYGREARLLEAKEAALGVECNTVIALSNADRDGFANLGVPTDKITVIDLPGQAFDLTQPAPTKAYDIGLIGSWQWDVNRQGILWFLSDVLPHLPNDLTVAIAGSGSETLPTTDPRVMKLGRMPDAGQFMRSCRALAVPTVVGSGIQLKTIEGISVGVPMVVTPLALRGINDAPLHVRDAQSASDFAKALTEAMTSDPTVTDPQWASRRRERFREALLSVFEQIGDAA